MKKHIFPLAIILLFSIVGMKALFHPGLFTAHDIWHQVARLYWYQTAINEGQIPPYWISTLANGLGYPLFFFSYHLPWTIALLFLGVGIGIQDTIKILFFTSYLFSGVSMYLLSFRLFKNRLSALIAAIFYLWVPYHFLTILVSAAMGISFAFTFAPLILLGLHLNEVGKKAGAFVLAIGLAALLLSHSLSLFALLPPVAFFGIWCFITSVKKINFLKLSSLGILAGTGLSAFYLLPATYYSHLTQISTGPFAHIYERNFINFSQLLYSKWGYGIPIFSAKEGAVSYQLGLAHWFVILATCLLLIIILLKKKDFKLPLFLFIAFSLCIFLMLDYSLPLWNFSSHFLTLDFPTMFLLPATLIASLLAAYLVTIKRPLRFLIAIFLIILVVLANRNHLRVNQYTYLPLKEYIDAEFTTNSYHEYLPRTADINIFTKEIPLIEPSSIKVNSFFQNTRELKLSVGNPQDQQLVVRQFVFPGLVLFVDGRRTDYGPDELGRIQFDLSIGEHEILVKFEETDIIKLAKLLSFVSLAALIYWKYAKKT